MTAFVVESWLWYSAAVCMIAARFVARIMHFKSVLRLQVEDFVMVFLTALYTILIVFLNIDQTVSTNLIDPSQPVDLTPHEIQIRTWGSKTVLLVEQCMCAVQWGTKACLLILYWRLTQNLTQNIVVKCAAAYIAVTYVVMEILYFGVWCRPFHDYWLTPTNNVQCTTALNHLIFNFAANLSSDILIMSIPLPLLLKARLGIKRKILLVFPFSLGCFTIACAIASKHLSFTQPYSADWVFWYCREASTAMIVTNMPYSWALIRRAFNLKSFFGESTTTEIQAGSVRELQGISVGGTRSGSAMLGQQSRLSTSSTKKGWLWPKLDQNRSVSRNEEDGISSWQPGTNAGKKETNVDTNVASSSSSSAGSAAKPPAALTADSALDKLYRLDDDDLEAPDVSRRHYDG